MDFQTSVRTCLTEKFATFSGRATRSEYWWFVLAVVIGALVVGFVHTVLRTGVLSTLYMLAVLVPGTAAGFRRLQDTGRPGWYILIPVGLGVLQNLLALTTMPQMGPGGRMTGMPGAGSMGLLAILSLVQLVLAVLFIYWLTRPSQPESNAYGPPPQA
mgnify:FL=1